MSKETKDAKIRTLTSEELGHVAGGFLWIPVVVGGFLAGTYARKAVDKVLK